MGFNYAASEAKDDMKLKDKIKKVLAQDSKYKPGDVVYNKKTKWVGPVTRLFYSFGDVGYYHGNNPCKEEDLELLGKRRELNYTSMSMQPKQLFQSEPTI